MPPLIGEKEMTTIHSEYDPRCGYNVQAFPEDEAHECGKKAIMKAHGMRLDMLYCKAHWAVAEERASQIATITDV